MQFANIGLLFGSLLIAVPVIMHLVMRQQPKQLEFPALRFVRQRSVQNQRQLQLKHWILLILRCLAIIALVVALARPGVASEVLGRWVLSGALAFLTLLGAFVSAGAWLDGNQRRLAIVLSSITGILALATLVTSVMAATASTGPIIGEQEAPVAAVLVFDTSPRMLYRNSNETRLETSQDLGAWLVSQLPEGSQIAVLDQRSLGTVFAPDRSAARQSVNRLEISVGGKSLSDLLLDALDMLGQSELPRKEIYVLTDMAAPAWSDASAEVKSRLAEASEIPLYVIDVGVDDVQNIAISDLLLSADSVPEKNDVVIQVDLTSDGVSQSRTVELFVEKIDDRLPVVEDGQLKLPQATRQSRQTLELVDGQSQTATFRLQGLEEGVHHGWVEIVGDDSLGADNRRWFSVKARKPWAMAVLESQAANGVDFINAVAPPAYLKSNRAAFRVETSKQTQIRGEALKQTDLVVLMNPTSLAATSWQALYRFVEEGNGLMIFLGPEASLQGFNGDEAQLVMPGSLSKQWRSGDRLWYLDPKQYQHQILSPFRDIGTTVPWRDFPVYRHWSFAELDQDANVVVRYNNGVPALVEQQIGRGNVLTFTSSISEDRDEAWNQLLTGFDSWPFFVLSNQMAVYAVQGGSNRYNYTAGDLAVVEADGQYKTATHLLFTPSSNDPQEVIPDAGQISIPFTRALGTYRVRPSQGGPSTGFSVNLPPYATDMEKISEEELDEVLGARRYRLAKKKEQIVREQGKARLGVPLYPWMVIFVVVVFSLEHLFANRFYRSETSPE